MTDTDWQAEAERLQAENTALKSQVVTLSLEKAAVAAQLAKLRANAALAVITLNTPI